MLVYQLTFANGKRYIGQTVKMLTTRITAHKAQVTAGSQLPVHCAWRKHGEPTVEVLERCGTVAELHAAERRWIAERGVISPGGYNVTEGGDTAPSKDPKVAAKIAAKATGRRASEETRAKIAAASAARWSDPEYRAKVAAGVDASWTPERRANMAEKSRARMIGNAHSKETIAKITARARNMSPETRAKMSAAAKVRKHEPRTAAHCASIATAVANSWQDPEIRAKRSAAIREGHRLRKLRLQGENE